MAQHSAEQIPRIGVGVFVLDKRNQTFILGQRLNAHGSGTHALPGGHLEHSESFEACAARETLEETGLEITNIRFLTATNSPRIDGSKHYVTVFMVAERVDGGLEPRVCEREKCAGWEWQDWREFVEWAKTGRNAQGRKLFQPMLDLVEQRPGIDPFSL